MFKRPSRRMRSRQAEALAMQSYARQMVPRLASCGRTLATISSLSREPGFGGEGWNERLAAAVAALESACRELAGVTGVPGPVWEAHEAILGAGRDLQAAAERLTGCLGEGTALGLEQATALVDQGAAELRRGTEMLHRSLSHLALR